MKSLFLFLFLLLFACENDLEHKVKTNEPKLVLDAVGNVGDSLVVYVSQSSNRELVPDLDLFLEHESNSYKLKKIFEGPVRDVPRKLWFTYMYDSGDYEEDEDGVFRLKNSFYVKVYYLPKKEFTVPEHGFLTLRTNFNNEEVIATTAIPENTIEVQDFYYDNIVFREDEWDPSSGSYSFNLKVKMKAPLGVYFFNATQFFGYDGFTEYSTPWKHEQKEDVDIAVSRRDDYYSNRPLELSQLLLYQFDPLLGEYIAAIEEQENADIFNVISGKEYAEIPSNVKNGYGIFAINRKIVAEKK